MKILIITGIFPPEIGGPARYSENLATELVKKKIKTDVLCYSNEKNIGNYDFPVIKLSKKYPMIIRNFLSLFLLVKPILNSDIVYVLTTSPGITSIPFLLSKIFKKKIILRPGSDFLWDRYTQKEGKELAVLNFYQTGLFKKKKINYFIFSYLIKNVDFIIFPTIFLRNLYIKYYKLKEIKSAVIDYPFPEVRFDLSDRNNPIKEIITACRFVRFKNLNRLIEAFSRIDYPNLVLKIIGDGPQEKELKEKVKLLNIEDRIIFEKTLPHSELLKRIKKSYLVIIPSIFEPGSFLGLESLKLKVPVLFTKEAGLYDQFKNDLIFLDPFSVEDIKEKIEYLLNKENYDKYCKKIAQINTSRNWSNVADDHIKVFKNI
jgi:glycosyltransferase involved in cell wall biosynthesis